MSVDYASGLSDYDDLGVCGIPEVLDPSEQLAHKILQLSQLLRQHIGSTIIHTGAGISTAAGIPDFRGPRGVWTKKLSGDTKLHPHAASTSQRQFTHSDIDKKQESSNIKTELELNYEMNKAVTFDTATPTFSHMALKQLVSDGFVAHIVSQNVDGLFLKANVHRSKISELHGNFFLDECTKCKYRFIRSTASFTMGLKKSSVKCPRESCIGHLRDTILDWESAIPYNELRTARARSKRCRLHIVIGTTMQLMPANELPLEAKKGKGGKLVVINLQPTKLSAKADLVIHGYADDVMRRLTDVLDVHVTDYDPTLDPTKLAERIGSPWLSSA